MNLIMIDPGHGGSAPGAVVEGAVEKDINLSVSLELAQILSSVWDNYIPILTRYTDTTLTLRDRCAFERTYNPLCFVSIHCNAATSEQANGFEVFTTVGETAADKLATKVLDEVKKSFPGLKIRSDVSDGDEDKEANFAVLRGTKSPAILVECGFLSNDREREMLLGHQFHVRIAAAIAYGITRWNVAREGTA